MTIAFTQSDLQLGMCGWTATTGEGWTEDWAKVNGRPGAALALCRRALDVLPTDLADRLAALIARSERLRQERNQINHSALIFDPSTTQDSHPWLTRDTKGTEAALLSAERGYELTAALNALSRDASELRASILTHQRRARAAGRSAATLSPEARAGSGGKELGGK